jgi:tight junction protein 1
MEFEQRTLKFTLSKSRKKDDFGIVLGYKFYIKEITNPKLAEKEPGLKEGDSVLRINGTSLDNLSLDDATRLLQKSHEKLSLVIQRDVRRGTAGSRWPSQTTVYERLGSVSATPRHSPTPMAYSQTATSSDVGGPTIQHISRRPFDYSPNTKRYSDPSAITNYTNPSQFPLQHVQPQNYGYAYSNGVQRAFGRAASQTPSTCSSPRVYIQQHNQYAVNQSPVPSSNHQMPQRSFVSSGERIIETAHFQKQTPDSSLGIRVIGGNHVGIFVSAVQADSPAAKNNIR